MEQTKKEKKHRWWVWVIPGLAVAACAAGVLGALSAEATNAAILALGGAEFILVAVTGEHEEQRRLGFVGALLIVVAALVLVFRILPAHGAEDCRNLPPDGQVSCGPDEEFCYPEFGSEGGDAYCARDTYCGGAVVSSCYVHHGTPPWATPTPATTTTPKPTAPPAATPTPDFKEQQRVTDQLKNQAHMAGDILTKEGTAMGAIAPFLIPVNPPAAATAAELSALLSLGGLLMGMVDPFDAHWPEPVKPELQPFNVPTGLSKPVTDAYRALAQCMAARNALIEALGVATDRANSALTMGDKAAEAMHVAAIRDFRRRAGARVTQEKGLRRQFVRLYKAKYGSTVTPEGKWPDLLVDTDELGVMTSLARELSR